MRERAKERKREREIEDKRGQDREGKTERARERGRGREGETVQVGIVELLIDLLPVLRFADATLKRCLEARRLKKKKKKKWCVIPPDAQVDANPSMHATHIRNTGLASCMVRYESCMVGEWPEAT